MTDLLRLVRDFKLLGHGHVHDGGLITSLNSFGKQGPRGCARPFLDLRTDSEHSLAVDLYALWAESKRRTDLNFGMTRQSR
jgi:hypothetical protein